ncbi:MAG: ATP-binding protein [Trichodesmium sp. MO_231.B1]|nr:ATP-binding protein [Trichodesmium sp. MO_231.B1]
MIFISRKLLWQKLIRLQNQFKELSGGKFQKLADAYLHKKIKQVKSIQPLGSVIGANKTKKGTPDSLIILENGKYILAEYTTEEKGICKKFKNDLDKCFNEEKTGISIAKIEKIVLCHNSTLTTKEENSLKEECQKYGVELDIFGIDSISFDLYKYYPGIARDFLGVEVDTGQVVDIDEFITTYNKRKIIAPLDTKFYFREDEINEILERLEEHNLVIVYGKAGVGKSRLVLDCCRKFVEKYSEYEVKCIFDRGVDLCNDIRVYFSDEGSYLIFLDDANRVKEFKHFIHLLLDQRENQQIKIIATVRDYAVEQIKEVAHSYDNNLELVKIDSLTDKQIEQLVKEECQIQNQLYIERIVDIAQGNPRFAIMTSLVVQGEETIKGIKNVSDVYDLYYSSITKDIEDFKDESLLEVAGIFAFFQVVDNSNDEMMEKIQTAFNIEREIFWEAVRKLYKFELVDIYENEIARISDQVLATYLFYLTFFKDKLLKFSVLLDNFFPQFQYNFVDALNLVLSAFDSGKIIKILTPEVDRVWKNYKEAGDEKSLIQLMKLFCFFKQTEILIYAKDFIDQMEVESVDISTLDILSNSNIHIPQDSILSLLSLFGNYDEENSQKIAIDLLFEYLTKKPQELPQVFCLIIEVFGFERDSYITKFITQSIVIDKLLKKVNGGKNELFAKLFFGVAEKYLYLQFNTSHLKKRNEFTLYQFPPPATPELFDLRKKIWQGIFQLYQIDIFQKEVINIIHTYSNSFSRFTVTEIIKQDAVEVLEFLTDNLNPKDYYHCLIVQKYLDFLEFHKVEFNHELRESFINETYELSRILLSDWSDRKNSNLEYTEYEQLKQNQIKEYFANYDFKDYQDFFDRCHEIKLGTELINHNNFYFTSRIVEVLITLACQNSELYIDVLKYYLNLGDPFELNNFLLIAKLIEIYGVEKAFEFLNQSDKEKELSISRFRNTILERIFLLKVTEKDKVTLEDRQNKLLESLIESRYKDIDMMQLLFRVITTFPYERRYQFIDLFCKYNQNFEDFNKLPLKPSIWNLSGSYEPTYESYAKYFKSLLPIFNTVELMKHKQYVEQEIKYFENRIKNQKKEDFIRDSYHVRLNSYFE